MEKLDLQSPNWVNENSNFIAERFPNCVTETADGIKVDFDLLEHNVNPEEGRKKLAEMEILRQQCEEKREKRRVSEEYSRRRAEIVPKGGRGETYRCSSSSVAKYL
jgi:hypothetical protein